MYTMAALVQNGRTFLLQNFAATVSQAQWDYVGADDERLPRFALAAGGGEWVDAGLNGGGLALLRGGGLAGEGAAFAGQVLSLCRDVGTALDQISRWVSLNPNMPAGHIMLGDSECVAVLEHGGGRVQHEVVTDGFVVRSDYSQFGLVDNGTQNSELRYERLLEFTEGLYAWMPTLDGEDVVERCCAVLRQEPLCSEATSSSAVIEVGDGRVDYFSDRWQTHRL